MDHKCTAAIEGLESSPFSGWVTSAPNIIVGMSLTNGILQLTASTRTVFLPPICIKKRSNDHYLVVGSIPKKSNNSDNIHRAGMTTLANMTVF